MSDAKRNKRQSDVELTDRNFESVMNAQGDDNEAVGTWQRADDVRHASGCPPLFCACVPPLAPRRGVTA